MKINRIFTVIIPMLLFFSFGNCQNTEATKNLEKSTLKIQSQTTHSPKKATIYSAILPGWGQIYNHKYWKVPIVYAGFGAMTYFFVSNSKSYNDYKEALILRNDGDENTIDQFATQLPNQQSLIEYADYYRRNRDLSVIGFALMYVLNIVDANVDANLYDFDVSDNLSLHWKPAVIPGKKLNSGLCFTLQFK